jgi:UDPglucose 6-dehydrogenase
MRESPPDGLRSVKVQGQDPRNGRRQAKLGVVGLGAVGSALSHVLDWFYTDVEKFDIVGHYNWDPILRTDAVFICVATPAGSDGRLDCTQVTEVLGRLEAGQYKGVAVIRSTVRVGFMDHALTQFPSLRLVYAPEFLRERSRFQWSANPDRLVVSGSPKDIDLVAGLFDWMEEAIILRMSHTEAEIGKLAHNAYIATKVSFTNTIADVATRFGADPSQVMSVVWNDRRVRNRAHLDPTGGPYGGSCVPKDTHELVVAGGTPILLVAVEKVNSIAGCDRPSQRPIRLPTRRRKRA